MISLHLCSTTRIRLEREKWLKRSAPPGCRPWSPLSVSRSLSVCSLEVRVAAATLLAKEAVRLLPWTPTAPYLFIAMFVGRSKHLADVCWQEKMNGRAGWRWGNAKGCPLLCPFRAWSLPSCHFWWHPSQTSHLKHTHSMIDRESSSWLRLTWLVFFDDWCFKVSDFILRSNHNISHGFCSMPYQDRSALDTVGLD